MKGLSGLSFPTLEAIRAAVETGALTCPVNRAGLIAAGFSGMADAIEPILRGVDRSGAMAVMNVAIAERVHRPASNLELVWTGPLTPHATNRDTGVVMRELFAKAERSVIVAGYTIDDGASLFEPLHKGMVERGVQATLFVNIDGEATSPAGGAQYANEWIADFLKKQWPFRECFPDLYYDPRTVVAGPPWVSMHAKCVVVDNRWSFVTSANFTGRAQERNIELGVLIEDERFAEAVVRQWQTMIRAGLVTQY